MTAERTQDTVRPRARLRQLLITDSTDVAGRSADIVLWLGAGGAPAPLATRRSVIAPASLRAAAVYVAAAPTEFKLALADPLAFMAVLADVRDARVLSAA